LTVTSLKDRINRADTKNVTTRAELRAEFTRADARRATSGADARVVGGEEVIIRDTCAVIIEAIAEFIGGADLALALEASGGASEGPLVTLSDVRPACQANLRRVHIYLTIAIVVYAVTNFSRWINISRALQGAQSADSDALQTLARASVKGAPSTRLRGILG
jgi:hypothetical protein